MNFQGGLHTDRDEQTKKISNLTVILLLKQQSLPAYSAQLCSYNQLPSFE